MDPVRQQRQMILPIVILVLGIVLIWWMWIWPRTPQFKAHKREARLKETLRNITPPAGDEPGDIKIVAFLNAGQPVALGTYSSKSHCATVEAHYKEEFAKHGFTYMGEKEASKAEGRSLSFSAQDYGATLGCSEIEGSFRPYLIMIWSNARD